MNEKQINQLIDRYGFSLEETHISWVLIGEKTAYKIKKPVNFGFLDYSSLDKRLKFCKKEVELNRRLAADMYLGVSSIVQTEYGVDMDKAGEIIDYAVKMKRIPHDRMMDVLIRNNTIKESHIESLARIVADFHKKAATNEYIKSFGSIEVNRKNTDENFQQTADAVGEYITRFEYETIKKFTDEFYEKHADLFERRIREDKIRDCHGDMYSRNICIISEEKIYIYDCIEFNERFRYSDVASDVAFLLMDMENFSRYDLSENFLKHYIEYSKDSSLSEILDFYKIYRAYVRGKISYFQKQKREAALYFDLAFGYLPHGYKPKLIMMCGLTGAGKSEIAKHLSRLIDAVVLSSDIIRKQLAGMSEYEKDLSEFGKGIYTEEMTEKVYDALAEKAYSLLREGRNVILDATFLKEKQREKVKQKLRRLNIEPAVVFVDVDDSTARKHLQKREKEKSTSDGRYEIYIKQREILERPEECITVNGADDPALSAGEIANKLK